MEWLISMFIDDEMNLDEKIEFVEKVHEDAGYKDRSVQLLEQEKMLGADVVDVTPPLLVEEKKQPLFSGWRLFMGLGGGLVVAACLFLVVFVLPESPQRPPNSAVTVSAGTSPAAVYAAHRFVIYQPDAGKMEIAGSFSDWNTVPMKRAGAEGTGRLP